MLAEETWTVRGGEIREVHAALRPRCGDWTLKRFENTGDGQTDTRHARSLIRLGETAGGEWPAVLTYFSLIWDSSNQCDKLILLSPLLGSFAAPKRCRSTSMLSVKCWKELRNLLVQLQESQNHGEQEERKPESQVQSNSFGLYGTCWHTDFRNVNIKQQWPYRSILVVPRKFTPLLMGDARPKGWKLRRKWLPLSQNWHTCVQQMCARHFGLEQIDIILPSRGVHPLFPFVCHWMRDPSNSCNR